MSFEFLIAKDLKGSYRLRLLYIKLYFSDKPVCSWDGKGN